MGQNKKKYKVVQLKDEGGLVVPSTGIVAILSTAKKVIRQDNACELSMPCMDFASCYLGCEEGAWYV